MAEIAVHTAMGMPNNSRIAERASVVDVVLDRMKVLISG